MTNFVTFRSGNVAHVWCK